MSELVREHKAEETDHMQIFPYSAHGPIEVQLLRYAKLRNLDDIFVDLFEYSSEDGGKRMFGACYQLSALVRFSKKMEVKSGSPKERDDFSRIQAYIKAITAWDGTEKNLLQKIDSLDETVETAFSRMIGYIWQLHHLDTEHTEFLSYDGIVRHKTEYEYGLSFLCKKPSDLVTQLLKHPNIFREDRQIEVNLMCYEDEGREVSEQVGHRISVGKNAFGFFLADTRNKTPFQYFSAIAYEEFLTAIFAAGAYQIHSDNSGLCVTFRVERPLQISNLEKNFNPKLTTPETYVYPSHADFWSTSPEPTEIEKNLLLFTAAKHSNWPCFDFWLRQIKILSPTKTKNNFDVFYYLIVSDSQDQLIKLLDRIRNPQSPRRLLTTDQEETLEQIEKQIQENTLFLYSAARNNCVTVLEPLIELGCDPFALDKDEATPFVWAAALGNLAVVKKFLKLNPDHLHFKSPSGGFTVLHWLADCQYTNPAQLEIISKLLKMGADQSMACKEGYLPFCLAAKRGDIAVMKIFLSAAATPAAKLKIIQHADNAGNTAITYLRQADDDAAWTFLIEVLADIFIFNSQASSSEPGLAAEPSAIETPRPLLEMLDSSPEDQAQPTLFAVPDIKSRTIAVTAPGQASFFHQPTIFIDDTSIAKVTGDSLPKAEESLLPSLAQQE